jgi:hypothetical protein
MVKINGSNKNIYQFTAERNKVMWHDCMSREFKFNDP